MDTKSTTKRDAGTPNTREKTDIGKIEEDVTTKIGEAACPELAVLLTTDLPLPLFKRGKTRDVYDLDQYLLIVTTDRISAFDVVLPCGIPNKGRILNQLSAFWFEKTKYIIPSHLMKVVDDVKLLDAYIPEEKRFTYPSYLAGRSMITKKLQRIPIECVVRGYLAGSAWEEYREHGTVLGMRIIPGLLESQNLPQPIFTPTTKAEEGHDMPISIEEIRKMVGQALAKEIEEKSLEIYDFAQKYTRIPGGFFVADTKLEFGLEKGRLTLIDELLTPDSSRFWDIKSYWVGRPQDSFDKQPVRDWLMKSCWNKEPPAPALPPEIIKQTSERYQQVYERLTGKKLE
jgi:phosphoribosylaminoimidazole-succinocarboxamide synthase